MGRATPPGEEEVLWGAVFGEFEAGRKPFMNITHPLGFLEGMPDETVHRIMQRLAERPPRLIILDGYTERTYLRHVESLKRLVAESYDLVGEVSGSRYPVKVYALREQLAAAGMRPTAGGE